MKKFLLIALPIAVFFTSCQKEQTPVADETVVGDCTFTAYIEDCVKTELNGDLDVLWCEGDSLSVFDEAGTNFKFVTNDSGKTATFSKVTEGEMVGETFYAVYPYRYNASIEEGSITTNTASSYTLSGTSFTRSASAVMAAKTSNNELHFKNVSSLLQFTIPSGVSIKKLYFYAGGRDLSGEFKFQLDDQGTPVITGNPGTSNGVTMISEGVSFPAGTYYLPVLPATYNNLRIQITYADDKACTVSEAFSINQLTAERNKIRNIGTIYDGRSHYKWLTFEDGNLPGTNCFATENDGLEYTVIDNPTSDDKNNSLKVVKFDRFQYKTNDGYTKISLNSINGNIKKKITGIVFHYLPNGTKLCPRIKITYNDGKSITSGLLGPMKVNNSALAPTEDGYSGDDYSIALSATNWNVLTFKASQVGLDSFEKVENITIRPFCWKSGTTYQDNISISVFIDNIGFCFD